MRRRVAAALAALCVGCAPPSPPPARARRLPAASRPVFRPARPPDASVAVRDGGSVRDAGSDAPSEAALPSVAFPPPAFSPPVARTAADGDGVWTELPGGGGAIVRTVVHPHAFKKFVYAAIVAVDLERIGVKLVAGTIEPVSKSVPRAQRSGLVSAADQSRLIAVFNGGFKAQDGHYGMGIGRQVFLPPRQDESCTVGLYGNGRIRIGRWQELDHAGLAAWRQTPPCLARHAVPSPDLDNKWKRRHWGMNAKGKEDIRRSAVGTRDGGRVLLFGLGEWITPRGLTRAMLAAGAEDVAELDINWSYTRFILFDASPEGGAPAVSGTLIPEIKYLPGEYVSRASTRDFFYLFRRR